MTAETADLSAAAWGVRPVDGWFLDEMRARAERRAEAIRARYEWIEARQRALWARMDRLRDEIGPCARYAEGCGHKGSPGAGAPFAASPAPGHDGSPEALAPFVAASPSSGRLAAIHEDLLVRVEALLGIVRGPGPVAVWDEAPPPEAVVEAGAAG